MDLDEDIEQRTGVEMDLEHSVMSNDNSIETKRTSGNLDMNQQTDYNDNDLTSHGIVVERTEENVDITDKQTSADKAIEPEHGIALQCIVNDNTNEISEASDSENEEEVFNMPDPTDSEQAEDNKSLLEQVVREVLSLDTGEKETDPEVDLSELTTDKTLVESENLRELMNDMFLDTNQQVSDSNQVNNGELFSVVNSGEELGELLLEINQPVSDKTPTIIPSVLTRVSSNVAGAVSRQKSNNVSVQQWRSKKGYSESSDRKLTSSCFVDLGKRCTSKNFPSPSKGRKPRQKQEDDDEVYLSIEEGPGQNYLIKILGKLYLWKVCL